MTLEHLIRELTASEFKKLERGIGRTVQHWKRVNAGGDMFGWDWQTFRVSHPGTYRVYRLAVAEFKRRGGYRKIA